MIPVILKDPASETTWLVKMPAAPILGSIISVSFPDSMVHKVVRAVNYECMGAEIYKTEVKANRNEYADPWNPTTTRSAPSPRMSPTPAGAKPSNAG